MDHNILTEKCYSAENNFIFGTKGLRFARNIIDSLVLLTS